MESIKDIEINGILLSVKEAGIGDTIILLHGRGYSKENMDLLFDHYKNNHHVISYDVRGHGQSSKPESFTLDDHAEDLYRLILYYQLNKPVVIGFSMGSYISIKTAEKYPGLFSKIILIGTKGSNEYALNRTGNVFAPQIKVEDIKAFDKAVQSKHVLTEKEKRAIDQSIKEFDLLHDIKKINIPSLVMTGEYDGINPPQQGKEVSDLLLNSKFEIIPNAGHIAFFENSQKVFSLIDDFLDRDF